LPGGTVPAYLAFPLGGGEHLPGGTPTVTSGPRSAGTTVGPLNLTPLVQAELNAALDSSKMAVVATPHRNFAVECLPRYARTQSQPGLSVGVAPSSAGGQSGSQATSPASTPTSTSTSISSPSTATPSSTTPVNPTIEGIPLSQLENWAKQGT